MTKEEVLKIRQQLGLTQKQLADALGYDEDYISKVERGVKPVTEGLKQRIEEYCEDGQGTATMADVIAEADLKNRKIIVKALQKFGEQYIEQERKIELAKETKKDIVEMAKRENVSKEMLSAYVEAYYLGDFDKQILKEATK